MISHHSVDGFHLAHDRSGSGAPAVLLHGWPGYRGDFADVAGLLDADVICPDLRGFGDSDKHADGDYTAAGQARSVVGLMDELGVDRAVLAGYDIGSRIAQVVATEYPDRVSALVLAPPLPGIGRRILDEDAQREFWYQTFHRLPIAHEIIDGRPEIVRAYLRHFWTHWSGPDFTPHDDLLDRLARYYGAPGAFTASIAWYRAGAATVARSLAESPPQRRIDVPTTVLWPEFDPIFPRAWSDRVDEWFSNATLRLLDGAGHFVPVEAPHEFASTIQDAVDM
ncbi:hydrolase [Pseudonocardia sulfidoxydans NBRC 16205]|uniref:Hydrolase n=2 Tax=Pseudonocardia sulfidoxydans TaxID=54011 RepID=A0A511DCZ2_9PSEU|nr:alpha/beta hydrolase [Pseudonocardia sulfidoxydans]GEL22243.1 hydrolase [Pseudonocardia sulfidoxydans NBRC 16205]